MTPEQEAMERARKSNAANVGEFSPEQAQKEARRQKFIQWQKRMNDPNDNREGINNQEWLELTKEFNNGASSGNPWGDEVMKQPGNQSRVAGSMRAANAMAMGNKIADPETGTISKGPLSQDITGTDGYVDQMNAQQATNLKAEDGADGSAPANAYNPDKIKESLGKTVDNYGAVEDYYKNSATNAWNELGEGDQRILLYDQLRTMLRNNAQYKPKLYGAFGNVVDEGQAAGTEKSKLDSFLSENLKKGLERRNTRLSDSLETQLSQAGFEPKLEMAIRSAWENLKTNNRAKVHLINLMKDVDFMDAMKAGAVSIAANGQIVDRATGTILGKL